MSRDAERRIRRLQRLVRAGRRGGEVSSSRGAPAALGSRRRVGLVLTLGGAAVSGVGFGLNAGLYDLYYRPETERMPYIRAREAVATMLVVGITGAAVGGVGLVLVAAPEPGTTVSIAPGPVTAVTVRGFAW